MLKQVKQPFDTQTVLDGINAVNLQIKDLLTYAQSQYSETVYNQLFHNSETILNTETSAMQVDDLVSHLEHLLNTREAVSHHIQTYQQELNSRLNKLLRSVGSYVPVNAPVVQVEETAEESTEQTAEQTTQGLAVGEESSKPASRSRTRAKSAT